VIVVFALMAVVIHAPVSNGELLFNRYRLLCKCLHYFCIVHKA